MTIEWQLQPLPYLDRSDRAAGFRVPDGYEARQIEGRMHLVRPKSNAGLRVIPLVPVMAGFLDEWRRVAPPSPHGLVWPAADGGPRSTVDDRAEWRALQDTAEVRHPSGRYYHGHEARHTAATLLMQMGVDESVRIAIMGHSSIAVTRGYEHLDVSQMAEALQRQATLLELG